MIRFLQTDNRVTKALLVVIIGAASVSMCVYLIPGLMAGGAASADTFAVVYPHWYSKYFRGERGKPAKGGADGPPAAAAAQPAVCRQSDDPEFF